MNMMEIIAIVVLLAILSNLLLKRRKKKKETIWILIPHLTTVIKCSRCKFKETRDFEEKDFVAKKYGNCPKCKRILRIVKIFTPDKTAAEKKWEAYAKKFAV